MLIILTGNVGSGKTALASVMAKYSTNRIIKSNYFLNLKNAEKLEPETLINLDNTKQYLIIIDECYVWLESLTSGSKIERYLSYILFQSRKLNIDIILTSQLIRRVNINFKEMEDVRVECYKDKDNKQFVYTFKFYDKNEYFETTYEVSFKDMADMCNIDKKTGEWTLFKTMEIINPPEMKELALEFIMKDKTKLNKLVNDICDCIKLDKITKTAISDKLLELGYSQKLVNPVYNRLVSKYENENI